MQGSAVALILLALALGQPALAQSAEGPLPPLAPTPDEAVVAPAPAVAPPSKQAVAPAATPPPAQSSPTADANRPPSAPTPDEALAAPQPAPSAASSQPAASQNAADSNEATRKAQEDGSYPLKDGGRFEPPASRTAPLWNKSYGRT